MLRKTPLGEASPGVFQGALRVVGPACTGRIRDLVCRIGVLHHQRDYLSRSPAVDLHKLPRIQAPRHAVE